MDRFQSFHTAQLPPVYDEAAVEQSVRDLYHGGAIHATRCPDGKIKLPAPCSPSNSNPTSSASPTPLAA